MSSQTSPTAAVDQYVSRPSANLPPPPPRPSPSESARPDSLRRHNVARLPELSTNIAAGQGATHLPTPLSTTSLSSPFAQNNPAYTPPSGPGSRGVSPMASRGSAYNVPYNPSQWAPGSRRTSQNEGQSRAMVNLVDGLGAPPPPYSPPSRDSTLIPGEGLTVSPSDTNLSSGNPSQQNTPTGTVGVLSSGAQRDSIGSAMNISVQTSMHYPPPPSRNSVLDIRQSALLNRSRPVSVSSLSQVMNVSSQLGRATTPRIDVETGGHIMGPPAARRAASAGAVSTNSSSCQSRDHSESRSVSMQGSWVPGMPLPGPPPGPPPASSRSHSANATPDDRRTSPSPAIRNQTYRVPLRPPLLSPMPPTPAGWTEDQPLRSATRPSIPLHIQTTNLGGRFSRASKLGDPSAESHAGPSSSGSLARSAAIRDSSAKGLRERRNLRKSLHDRDFADLSALTVNTNPWADAMTSAASTNRSPSGFSDSLSHFTNHDDSLVTSPVFERPGVGRKDAFKSPVSPIPGVAQRHSYRSSSAQNPPKALPTPPLSQNAPVSGQSVFESSSTSVVEPDTEDGEGLIAASLQRHRDFLMAERTAASQTEKLRIFSDYMIAESALRRDWYDTVFNAKSFDIETVREKLFATRALPKHSAVPVPIRDPNASAADQKGDSRTRPETMWWKEYRPALSPIASMSNDEISSRGRTPSRWWESQGDSQTEGGTRKAPLSKRESKYMGLSTALLNSSITEDNTPIFDHTPHLQDDQYAEEKANPESFGIYDDDHLNAQTEPLNRMTDTPLIDISRFITLPPPYPRHYPAVNNSHPLLTTYRNTVRRLSDMAEVRDRKARHATSAAALKTGHEHKVAEARKSFKSSIQEQISDGTISYAEAAEAEEALRLDEKKAEKECLKAQFDTMQDVVINPLHDLLNERLVRLSASIDELTEKLFVDNQRDDPDRAQQEGDDTPELLEHLTQLKWLFETREQVHRELFDLLTERNDMYRAIVVLPYQQANNLDKVRDTEQFFVRDSRERIMTFYRESLERHEQFFNIVEDNVTRGVQLQSSAFWDIAPSLATLLQGMPPKVEDLDLIAIPEQEYLENPSYHELPQQYLYTLLEHAEKSTYQFIESQINLHCLLHEVKSSALSARCRTMDTSDADMGRDERSPGSRASEFRAKEESKLTAELQQQVNMIEEQWLEALGSQLQGRREQVRAFLQERGGWEEIENGADSSI